jgi:hypothetical protein
MCLHPSVVTILAVVTGVVKQLRRVMHVIPWDKDGGVVVGKNLRDKEVLVYAVDTRLPRTVATIMIVWNQQKTAVVGLRKVYLQTSWKSVTKNIVSDACMMI